MDTTSHAPAFSAHEKLATLAHELRAELNNILQWWASHTLDEQSGGFYGRIDGHGCLHPQADKGVILNARILWTFSAAAKLTGHERWRALAERAYTYFLPHFWDKEEGGVYWMLSYDGRPSATKKQIYAQAFAIYGLTAYYQLSQEREAIEKALELFWLIEEYSYDQKAGGYLEAFSKDWAPLEDPRLSDKDLPSAKTMNTHLHLLEAYSSLYSVTNLPEVGLALKRLIHLFLDQFIDPHSAHLHLFFDADWQLNSHEWSFGHDIECSWLLYEAATALADEPLLRQTEALAIRMAEAVTTDGLAPDGSLYNEADHQGRIIDAGRDWWPQAEAMVGFCYAARLSGNPAFLQAAWNSWQFIRQNLLDTHQGEWYWGISASGQPNLTQDKAGPWKCPYHNARACLEIIGINKHTAAAR